MPDVAQRVEDLRRRMQDSAVEAEQRRARSAGTADDWRRIAARPRPSRGGAHAAGPAAEHGR